MERESEGGVTPAACRGRNGSGSSVPIVGLASLTALRSFQRPGRGGASATPPASVGKSSLATVDSSGIVFVTTPHRVCSCMLGDGGTGRFTVLSTREAVEDRTDRRQVRQHCGRLERLRTVKFALVDGERSCPIKGQRGICAYCGGDMVAKCGRFRVWHWAHMPGGSCDPWWGPESEWHREWKNRFPADWQEVIHIDERTGEKHIADVKTPFGLVVEFQRSPIDYEELISREAFYQNMVWVVDGDRGSLDPNYFTMGFSGEPASFRPLVHLVEWWSPSRLLHKWHETTAPVHLD